MTGPLSPECTYNGVSEGLTTLIQIDCGGRVNNFIAYRFGGDLLVTDMRRGQSLFEVLPDSRLSVEQGVESEGSLLSGVSALCGWQDNHGNPHSANISMDPELCPISSLEEVHLMFNMEAVQLWPLAIKLVIISLETDLVGMH